MGQDLDPWLHWEHLPWQIPKSNEVQNLKLSHREPQMANSLMFSAYNNPTGQAASVVIPPGFDISKFLQMGLACNSNLSPTDVPNCDAPQRRFLIFDQTGDQTKLAISSMSIPQWNLDAAHPKQIPTSTLTDFQLNFSVSNNCPHHSDENGKFKANDNDEMHEDTEEINALLESDSEDERETSTGQTSLKTLGGEEVVCSTASSKRIRVPREIDASLLDTASSARVHLRKHASIGDKDANDKSSFVKGTSKHMIGDDKQDYICSDDNRKRLKRDRIHETLGVLRQIIPGGDKGKDAAVVLEEAIQYLRSLKDEVLGAAG